MRASAHAADRLAMTGEATRAQQHRMGAGRQRDQAIGQLLVLEHQHRRAARVRALDHIEDHVLADVIWLRAARAHVSTRIVTGPSLTSVTAMCAPNTPRCAPARSQKRSYRGSACSAGAAAT